MISGADLSFSEKENFVPFLFFLWGETREWPGKEEEAFETPVGVAVWNEEKPEHLVWREGQEVVCLQGSHSAASSPFDTQEPKRP